MALRSHTPELSFLLHELLKPFPAACLVNHEGQILGAKFETLTDIGTFAPFVETIAKYFSLNEGDVVVCNDPNSGNPLLNALTIVTPFNIKDGTEQKYYLLCRTRLKPTLGLNETLRIPPTPIVQNKIWNDMILSVLGTHPDCPLGLTDRLKELTTSAWNQIALFKKYIQVRPQCFSKNSQKAWLLETRERLLKKISDVPRGEHRMEVQFSTGETIRLKTEIKSNEVHFDFAGTSISKNLFINEAVTFGVCLGAVLAFLDEDFLLNSGAYSLVNITTPQGSLLSSKGIPSFQGSIEIALALGSSVLQSISNIAPTKSIGAHRSIPLALNFDFGDKKSYFEVLASGAAADAENPGLDAFYYWSLAKNRASIESIEKNYPLIVKQCGLRKGSGGAGKTAGGDGSIQEVEVLEDCNLSWLLGSKNFQFKGIKVSDSGKPAEILVTSKDGTKTVLKERLGEIQLKAGDKVLAMSAGGSGFGRAE
jgi:N-methylhydantoinase B/oxoprolinase/acetone carboxylase alpha subunit